MTNPFIGLLKTIFLFIFRRVDFDKNVIGKKLLMEDGHVFTIFRRATIKTNKKNKDPGAIFLVRFKPKNMSADQNIKFSKLPMMIFMGFKGFRSKYWAVNYETGLCQGLYEWQSIEDAENYSKSIAMKFMNKRSYPESVEYRIIDKDKESLKYDIR